MALGNLGWMATDLKDYPAAKTYFEQSLVIAQASGNLLGEARALNGLGNALAGLGQWDAATEAHLEAMKVFEEFDSEWGIAGSHSGLARVALAQGNVEEAFGYVDTILAYLEEGKILGDLIAPTEKYLICVHVLRAADDPRAREVLESAYAELQERAAKIKDGALRLSFLKNVPDNRELVKLWEEQQDK